MQPVKCSACDTRVLVAKYSEIHTSVQWLSEAEDSCPRFAASAEEGRPSAFVPSCPPLRETIDAAVRDGLIPESRFSEPAPLPAP
ncbi:hypothetical protein AB0L71_23825 [Streptomyces sp. NPDC052052]|uniref:hypothetical protein n=1 Tax=Streptomyces sp. NPDC052052 TaxID=3154756 RepID=UPI003433B493